MIKLSEAQPGATAGAPAGAISHWSTTAIPVSKKLDYWNELSSSCFIPLAIDARERAFEGAINRLDLGQIHLSRVTTTPTRVSREQHHVARTQPDDAYYLLHMQVAGNSVNRQAGREAVLTPGDFTLVDSTRAYTLDTDSEFDMLVCRLPLSELRKYLPYAPDVVATTVSGQMGAARVLKGLFESLWIEASTCDNPGWLRNTDDCVMQAIEMAYRGAGPAAGSERSGHAILEQASRLIQLNLLDPELNVGTIAAALNITPRYLQKLFATRSTTPTAFIQLQRLEMAKRMLARGDKPVTDVAFDVGFNDLSHFGRAFKRHTGQSPSKFRFSAN